MELSSKEAVEHISFLACSPFGWMRHDEPLWRILERKPDFYERFKNLKSDDLAKVAPWAIFGDQPKKPRRRRS